MFEKYAVDMHLKGVERVQYWDYVVRIQEWDDLMREYPEIWRGVLKCTDSYELLKKRECLPACHDLSICSCKDPAHYDKFSHKHDHLTNVRLEMMAYNEALDAIGDTKLRRCESCLVQLRK